MYKTKECNGTKIWTGNSYRIIQHTQHEWDVDVDNVQNMQNPADLAA